MTQETAIKLFEAKQIRSVWNDEDQKWYFSVADVIEQMKVLISNKSMKALRHGEADRRA